MKLYTIDNLDAVGTHSMTFPTDSIVYIGIKTDLQFPSYFNYETNELNEDIGETGRCLMGGANDLRFAPMWYKNYVIGHFWTGNVPFDGTISHNLSGYVPVYGPAEKEATRYSLTLSGENEGDERTFLYDKVSFGNGKIGILTRDENESPLGYASYIFDSQSIIKIGRRNITFNRYGKREQTKIEYADSVPFPNAYLAKESYNYFSINGVSGNLSATSLGTVTIDDFPVAEYVPVAPKKLDLRIKVEEKSYAYIYHPAVSEGE